MTSSLTGCGVFWSCISLAGALLSCAGFYLPYWIQGQLLGQTDAYFGPFRRCNYPTVTSVGTVEIVTQCGRYSSFMDIPSIWWQASTIITGIGACLSLLVALTAVSACCFPHVINSSTARAAGALQVLAGLLTAGGAALFPMGWGNREVKEACSDLASPYHIGTCQLSWSIWFLCGGVGSCILCFCLSFHASRVKPGSQRI